MNPPPEPPDDPSIPCVIHDMPYCGLCRRPAPRYRRGLTVLEVPPGHYVEIRGGKGVYHHPDCYEVTGDWDGAELATLGERLVRSPQDIRDHQLRSAMCCHPPTIT